MRVFILMAALCVLLNSRVCVAATGYPTKPVKVVDGVSGSWSALFAPKGTPREIVMKLNAEVGKILENKEMRDFYVERFLVPMGGTPEGLGERLREDIARWRDLIQKIGIVPQQTF